MHISIARSAFSFCVYVIKIRIGSKEKIKNREIGPNELKKVNR